MVKVNGVYYNAGEDVPMEDKKSEVGEKLPTSPASEPKATVKKTTKK